MVDKTPTVLAIDDEPLVRESIVAFLEDSGFNVLQAGDGKQAMELFHAHRPDVILCDLHMPVMSGLAVLEKVHQEDPEVPFIVVSGAGVVHDAVEALRLGAWDYIIKPITDLGLLERAIDRTLERARLLKENREYRAKLEASNSELQKSLEILKEDQEAGRTIQFSLLPQAPLVMEGYHLSHKIIPSLYLSGDFIDYFPINDQLFGFYIADVSGHGAPSAFVTVLLKSLVDQYLGRLTNNNDTSILNPKLLLRNLSHQFLKAKTGKYLTMIYGVVDTKLNVLTYCIGGHFPNPILSVGGENNIADNKFLEGSGFPIGIFDRAEYTNHKIQLPEKFNLVLFSDGVLEIIDAPSLADKEAYLLHLLKPNEPSTTSDLLQQLQLEHVRELPDDVAFLIVSRGF